MFRVATIWLIHMQGLRSQLRRRNGNSNHHRKNGYQGHLSDRDYDIAICSPIKCYEPILATVCERPLYTPQ